MFVSRPAVLVTRGWGDGSLGFGGAMNSKTIGEECGMRSLVLGAFIFVSFGLTANAAEPSSDAKVASHHVRRPACQWVTADRTLRLLRDTLPAERRIATERPTTRPVSTPVKEPVVKASRPLAPVRVVNRPEPTRIASRAEPVRLGSRVEARMPAQHLSLVVGVTY
jgi:hypothetical protein